MWWSRYGELIRSHRHSLAIDGIRYIKLDGQEIFDTSELIANLDRNAVKVEHSVMEGVSKVAIHKSIQLGKANLKKMLLKG